ncbi:hypothetical protein D3C78_1861280 [compost metagenome]
MLNLMPYGPLQWLDVPLRKILHLVNSSTNLLVMRLDKKFLVLKKYMQLTQPECIRYYTP